MIAKVNLNNRKRFWFIGFEAVTFLFISCLLNFNCYAQPISSSELIDNSPEYDGIEIQYEGEVIGEVMHRKDGTWVNVNDGKHSIGIWMTRELSGIIEYSGSYKAKGDMLRIKGVFNQSCLEHGGDLDIHAISLNKIKSGWIKNENIIPGKRNLVVILSVILCIIIILRISIFR